MANRLGAAIEELDLVIKRLKAYITDAWNQALLVRAAAAANIQAPDDTPPIIVRPQTTGIVNLHLYNPEMPGGAQ